MVTFRPLPVIISTGRSQPELVNEAMQRSAFAVVHKPTSDRGKRFADVASRLTFFLGKLAAFLKPATPVDVNQKRYRKPWPSPLRPHVALNLLRCDQVSQTNRKINNNNADEYKGVEEVEARMRANKSLFRCAVADQLGGRNEAVPDCEKE